MARGEHHAPRKRRRSMASLAASQRTASNRADSTSLVSTISPINRRSAVNRQPSTVNRQPSTDNRQAPRLAASSGSGTRREGALLW
ncbi:hypothetical protein BDW22DRAFT_842288 [Trametopsis cervina]|nr:hypothetical protein BDW22DRAFT_842288 [Trametopsis cervina]